MRLRGKLGAVGEPVEERRRIGQRVRPGRAAVESAGHVVGHPRLDLVHAEFDDLGRYVDISEQILHDIPVIFRTDDLPHFRVAAFPVVEPDRGNDDGHLPNVHRLAPGHPLLRAPREIGQDQGPAHAVSHCMDLLSRMPPGDQVEITVMDRLSVKIQPEARALESGIAVLDQIDFVALLEHALDDGLALRQVIDLRQVDQRRVQVEYLAVGPVLVHQRKIMAQHHRMEIGAGDDLVGAVADFPARRALRVVLDVEGILAVDVLEPATPLLQVSGEGQRIGAVRFLRHVGKVAAFQRRLRDHHQKGGQQLLHRAEPRQAQGAEVHFQKGEFPYAALQKILSLVLRGQTPRLLDVEAAVGDEVSAEAVHETGMAQIDPPVHLAEDVGIAAGQRQKAGHLPDRIQYGLVEDQTLPVGGQGTGSEEGGLADRREDFTPLDQAPDGPSGDFAFPGNDKTVTFTVVRRGHSHAGQQFVGRDPPGCLFFMASHRHLVLPPAR